MADKWEQYAVADSEPAQDKWEQYAVSPDFESNQEIATATRNLVDPLNMIPKGPIKSGLETVTETIPVLKAAKTGFQAMQPGQITRAMMNKATDNYAAIPNTELLPKIPTNGLGDLARMAMNQAGGPSASSVYEGLVQPNLTPRNIVGGGMDVAADPMTYVGMGLTKPVQEGIQSLRSMAAPTVEKVVDDAIMKIAKPSTTKIKTFQGLQKYKAQAATAVKSMLRNKSSWNLTDELGNVTDRLPESLEDASNALASTRKSMFRQYDAAQRAAGDVGVTIDLSPLSNEYRKVAESEAVRKVSPEMSKWALAEANKYSGQKVSPSVAQDMIELFNQELKAFYRNPAPQMAKKAAADAAAVARLRMTVDDAINNTVGGPSYQAMKNEYGALRTLEDDINRRLVIHARSGSKPFGTILADVFAKGDMLTGILTMEPTTLTSGVAKEGIIQWYKKLHNPDNMVKKLFKQADEAVRLGKSSIELPKAVQRPRIGYTPEPAAAPPIDISGPAQIPAPQPNAAVPTDPALSAMHERQVIEQMKQNPKAPGMLEQRNPELHAKALEELSQEPTSGVVKKIKPSAAGNNRGLSAVKTLPIAAAASGGALAAEGQESRYGKRADGSEKSSGFLGELKRPDGGISTEISIGVNIDGKEIEIPTLVPGLTKSEQSYLLKGNKPTRAIVDKAVNHAKKRIADGKSPFFEDGENDISTGIISQIESQNNPDAVNKKSGAVGIMQVMEKGALADWNKDHPKDQRNKAQLKDPQTNMQIGTWYLNEKIPAMLKAFKIEDSIENRLIAYNAGIGNLRKILAGKMKMPKETADYIAKYKKLSAQASQKPS